VTTLSSYLISKLLSKIPTGLQLRKTLNTAGV